MPAQAQRLASDAFGGYRGGTSHAIVVRNTDLGREIYLDGPPGTEAQVITALFNDGDTDVTIQRIETSASLIPKVEWSPYRETAVPTAPTCACR